MEIVAPICFYHSADLDGECSAAIVRLAHPTVELRGYNYHNDFPMEVCRGRNVVMVDVSLQPVAEMGRLVEVAESLVWIDHHKTAIEGVRQLGLEIAGSQEIGRAACELAWDYYFPQKEMPPVVRALGRYDVWDHSDPNTLPIQFGARLHLAHVESSKPSQRRVWDETLSTHNPIKGVSWAHKMCRDGRTVLRYLTIQNQKLVRSLAFETELDGLRLIACNQGLTNSQLFDSVWDPTRHDAMARKQGTGPRLIRPPRHRPPSPKPQPLRR